MEKFIGESVRFTVKCDNNRIGTITLPDYSGEQIVGKTHRNIQCKIGGQGYGFDGKVVEIVKIETYDYPDWVEASL